MLETRIKQQLQQLCYDIYICIQSWFLQVWLQSGSTLESNGDLMDIMYTW